MADPTNVNVPPAKAADPANINIPVHGTKFPSGATGGDILIKLVQGSDLGNGVTNSIVDSWIAPFSCYLRSGNYQTVSRAATQTFNINNVTATQSVVGATTPTSNTAAAITLVAAGQTVAAGDQLDLRVTTSGGGGACKGLTVHIFATPLSGSTTNPV